MDKRLTGKEWFKENKAKDFDDLTVEDGELDDEDVGNQQALIGKFEEAKIADDEPVDDAQQEGALYDKNLFAEELGDLDDDDIDFD